MRWIACAALLFCGACDTDPTELLLTVDSDLPTLAAVEIEITDNVDAGFLDGAVPLPQCVCVDPTACAAAMPAQPATPIPLIVPLDPGHQGTAPFEIRASAHTVTDCSDMLGLDDSAVVQFVPHERLAVSLALNEICLGVDCPDGETCQPTTGLCASNMTMGTNIDMSTSSKHDMKPHDMAKERDLASDDMAMPNAFTVLAPAPQIWDIALDSVTTALGYVDLTTGAIHFGTASGSSNAMLTVVPPGTTKVLELCATGSSTTFQFGVLTNDGTTSQIQVYTAGSMTPTTLYSTTTATLSSLQCARSADGAVFSWRSVTGDDQSTSTITLVDVAQPTGTPAAPVSIANAGAYQLARTGFPSSAMTAGPGSSGGASSSTLDNAVLFVPTNATAYKHCGMNLVHLTYSSGLAGTPVVTCPMTLESDALFAAATAGTNPLLVGSNSGGKIICGPSEPTMVVATGNSAHLAITPIDQTSANLDANTAATFSIALNLTGSTVLDLYTATGTTLNTSPLEITSHLATSSPVKIASDDVHRTYLTWVDASSNALLGTIVTGP